MSSPIQRRAARYAMRRASTKALAAAIKAELPLITRSEQLRFAKVARKFETCALTQYWRIVTPVDDESRLIVSNKRACGYRAVCPQCAYRMANTHQRRLLGHLDVIGSLVEYRPLLVTLSTRNRPLLTDLKGMLGDHQAALARFWKLKRLTDLSYGTFSSIELAIRGTPECPEAGIHSHSLFLVNPKLYFAGDVPAIWQPEFRELWRRSARLDYDPIVDVRVVRDADGGADPDAIYGGVREALKYIVSSESLFLHESGRIQVDGRVAIAILKAFHRVRVHRFDRIFSEAAKIARRKTRSAKTADSACV